MSEHMTTVKLHIFHLPVLTPIAIARLWAEASESRREQAKRYARNEDALRCLVGEALLRYALRQCGVDEHLTPNVAEKGKPYVDAPQFHYNISHGGDYVVIAWGESEVGVDVEIIHRSVRWEAIARKHFTPSEQEIVFADRTDEMTLASRFTLLWTRKESYVKYTGQGLAGALSAFSVDAVLPRGRVLGASGEPVDAVTESIFPDQAHIVSVCGRFDALCVRLVSEEELFKKI